ncbi:MAG: anti-sigma regulatory factor [Leptolyngbyaceae cyanobacterium bins.59]|nr:anti-sigma regulatory factor [Leptolyngbyaceae cyanobacterium bins.59]
MIAISPRSVGRNWGTISFASTLYLCPILDLLLADVPTRWRAELRLGLQEALVNAAKHGNKLDPDKKVFVRFSVVESNYWWMISDQGPGFAPPKNELCENLPVDENECGRGLYILNQVFDQVHWNNQGRELCLCKQMSSRFRLPLVR